ncbi:unnamed protein product [Adineta steineri]|uniref:Uncharacterized protein n=1 Tax=Adineta steineri TaxID=433720 RepID=A0A818VWG9_9BILA|nr:unnamed protein product [Adineta steineri]
MTTIAFRRLLDLVRNTTKSNMLQPALQTTVTNIIDERTDSKLVHSIGGFYYKPDGQKCSCVTQANCSLPSGFFDLDTVENKGEFNLLNPAFVNVTGFVVGCYAAEALLQSTLECFYDQGCLESVLRYWALLGFPIDQYNKILNKSRFSPQTSIDTLIDELFIEDWKNESSFSDYFQQCAPIVCTYTDSKQNSALYILSTVLSAYSGITLVLCLCIPLVINWWRSRRLVPAQAARARESLVEWLRRAWHWIRVKLVELNLFKTAATLTDPYKLQTSLIATRVYLVLICVSFIVVTIYTVIRGQMQIFTIKNPSRVIFEGRIQPRFFIDSGTNERDAFNVPNQCQIVQTSVYGRGPNNRVQHDTGANEHVPL